MLEPDDEIRVARESQGTPLDGWDLIQAFDLVIVQDDDTYLVRDTRFLLHGSGDTLADAVQDYKTALMEYYTLVEAGAHDNPFDMALLEDLTIYRRFPRPSGSETR